MAPKTRNQRLNGLHPLSYIGVNPTTPTNFVVDNRAPTTNDYSEFDLGDMWLDDSSSPTPPTAEDVYILVDKASGVATWVNFAGGTTALDTLTGDTGGAVGGDANDNINIITNIASLAAGSSVQFVGTSGSSTLTLQVTDANSNTILGNSSGNVTISGSNNSIFGAACGSSLTSADNNVFVGQNVAEALTTGDNNVIIGRSGGSNLTGSESNNTLLNHAGVTGTSGLLAISANNELIVHNWPGSAAINGRNIFVGGASGNLTLTGISNAAVGGGSLLSLTTGTANMSIGNFSSVFITTGTGNSAIGNEALASSAAGAGLTTGNFNVAVGYTAGGVYRSSESSNILFNNGGVLGESNTCRIGAATGVGIQEINRTFIHGIRGITTGINDAIAVLIDSAGQLGTVSSSIRYKENVQDMADASSAILDLRPVTFYFKSQEKKTLQYGLIAEEVHKIFPSLVVYDNDKLPVTVKYHDLPILLLNELQKLSHRIDIIEKNYHRMNFVNRTPFS